MLPLLVACVADAWLGRAWCVDPVLGAAGVPLRRVQQLLHLALVGVLAVPGAGDHLLRLAVPGGAGGGRAQAVRAGVRRRPVRPAPHRGVRLQELLLHLVVLCSGTAATTMVSSYIQDNIGWGLSFGIPCLVMVFALAMFLLGTRRYRYYTSTQSSPFARLARAFVALLKGSKSSQCASTLAGEDDEFNAEHREEVRGQLRLFPSGRRVHHLRRHLLPGVDLLHEAGRDAEPADWRHVPHGACHRRAAALQSLADHVFLPQLLEAILFFLLYLPTSWNWTNRYILVQKFVSVL